jgi:hypothetical protein
LVEIEDLAEQTAVVELAIAPVAAYGSVVETARMSRLAKWRLWGGGKWFGGLSWSEVENTHTSLSAGCHLLTVVEQRDKMLVESIMLGTEVEYKFVHDVAAQVVAQLGGRPKSSAQLITATRVATRIMRENDHRWAHIERDMPVVLTLCQTETNLEILQQVRGGLAKAAGKRMRNHDAALRLRATYGGITPA